MVYLNWMLAHICLKGALNIKKTKKLLAALLAAAMLIAAFGSAVVFAKDRVFARLTDPVSKWNYTYYYSGRITLMVYTGNSENVVVPD